MSFLSSNNHPRQEKKTQETLFYIMNMDAAVGGGPSFQWHVLLALLVVLITLSKVLASPVHYTEKYQPFHSNDQLITHWMPFRTVDDRDPRAAPAPRAESKRKSQSMKVTNGENLKEHAPLEDRAFGDEASMHASLLGRR